ncbi:18713_t:CDS:1, partial [Acaulospora morrowiae]
EDVCLKPSCCEFNFGGFDDNGLNEDYSQPSIGPSNYPFYQGELMAVPQHQFQNNELYSFPYVEVYFETQCSLMQLHEDFVRENTICG